MIKNKTVALVYRAASLLFAVAGILSLLGVFDGQWHGTTLFFYTAQSNLLAVALFALLTAKTIRGIRGNAAYGKDENACYFPRFSMVVVIDILVTFFVYWILLAPTLAGMEQWTFFNLSVHAVTPLLCLIDYILFTQPRHLKYRDVYAVLIYPIFYVIFATIAGFAGQVYWVADDGPVRFPYFFFDYDRIGVAMSLVYIGALIVIFLLMSHGFYLVDAKIRKKRSAK